MKKLLAALVVVAAVSFFPKNADAIICTNEVVHTYYNTCGSGRYVVGETIKDCDGYIYSWGSTSDFEERTVTNCCTGYSRTTYYECGTVVSNLDTCIC